MLVGVELADLGLNLGICLYSRIEVVLPTLIKDFLYFFGYNWSSPKFVPSHS